MALGVCQAPTSCEAIDALLVSCTTNPTSLSTVSMPPVKPSDPQRQAMALRPWLLEPAQCTSL